MIDCGDIRWLRAISKTHSRVHRGPVPQEPLERLVQLGLAERKVNRFKLTPKGRVVTAQARLSPERRINSSRSVESVSATSEQFAEEGFAVFDSVAQSRCAYFRTATRWQDAEAHYRSSACDQGAHPNGEGSGAVKRLNKRRISRPNGVAYHAIRCRFRCLARFVRGMVVRRFRSHGRPRLEQRAGGAQKYSGNNGKRCSQRGRTTQAKLSEPLAPI